MTPVVTVSHSEVKNVQNKKNLCCQVLICRENVSLLSQLLQILCIVWCISSFLIFFCICWSLSEPGKVSHVDVSFPRSFHALLNRFPIQHWKQLQKLFNIKLKWAMWNLCWLAMPVLASRKNKLQSSKVWLTKPGWSKVHTNTKFLLIQSCKH